MGDAAWVFFLEAGLALGLLIFIVWWTMFSKPDIAKREQTQQTQDQAQDSQQKDKK